MELPRFEALESPHAILFLLPAAIFVVVVGLTGAAGRSSWARIALAAARSALVLALVFATAGPSRTEERPAPVRFELFWDVSRSVGAEARRFAVEDSRRFLERLSDSHPGAEVRIAAFAGGYRDLHRGTAASGFPENLLDQFLEGETGLDPLVSDPTPALVAFATEIEAGVAVGRRIYTDGVLAPPPEFVRRLPGTTSLVPPPASRDSNARLTDLELPPAIRADEPLRAVLRYESGVPRRVRALLEVGRKPVVEVEVDLVAGRGEIDLGGTGLLLPVGRHEVAGRLETGDEEPLDDVLRATIRVVPSPHVLYVTGSTRRGERAPAPRRALSAQGVSLREKPPSELPTEASGWNEVSAVVLDRVAPSEISAEVAAAMSSFVEEGGGVLVLPRGAPEELLAWKRHALGDLLPLAGIPTPPTPEPESKPQPEKPEENKPKKLSDPDPEMSEEKEVDAPTLILMIVIDKSASMKQGGRLLYAKLGAIQTAKQLHPEDRIGVISYNEEATEVVPVRPAGATREIEVAIKRITASGGTNIEVALDLARELLAPEEAAVKMVILLSDGVTRPFNYKAVSESLVAEGISITTVGVGSEFDTATLTQLALYGRGTGPIPARSAREIPSVMIDVAARVIDRSGARKPGDRRPKKKDDDMVRPELAGRDGPRPDRPGPPPPAKEVERIDVVVRRPVSYLDGLEWARVPGLYGVHRTKARPGAWVSLGAGKDDPFLAHWRVGDGYVALLAGPPEGVWSRDLALWDGYSVWLAQLVRFLERDPTDERYRVEAEWDDDRAIVRVLDTGSRDVAAGGAWTVTEPGGAPLPVRELGLGGRLIGNVAATEGFARLSLTLPAGDVVPLSIPAPPPREVRTRGLDLERLESWRVALGGITETRPDDAAFAPLAGSISRRIPIGRQWIAGIALLFAVELVLKRWLGRRRP